MLLARLPRREPAGTSSIRRTAATSSNVGVPRRMIVSTDSPNRVLSAS